MHFLHTRKAHHLVFHAVLLLGEVTTDHIYGQSWKNLLLFAFAVDQLELFSGKAGNSSWDDMI